jgi:hypothetical protein
MFHVILTRDVLSVSLIIGSFFLKSHTTQRGANVDAKMCCTKTQGKKTIHSSEPLTAAKGNNISN